MDMTKFNSLFFNFMCLLLTEYDCNVFISASIESYFMLLEIYDYAITLNALA